MDLSQQEKDLIRQSYAKVAGIKEQAGQLFYQRLFEIEPSLREMFHRAPIETQAMKLMQVIEWVVERLDDVKAIKSDLDKLGKIHADYGVKVDHYPIVGSALVWTLKKGLGPEFTPEAESAWIELYTYLSGQMEP
jgi:hemoglobin-like flavoprotein